MSVGFLLIGAAAGEPLPRDQDLDLLDQVRRREQVAAQKLEGELRKTLRDTEKIAASNPGLALDAYEKMLSELDNDTVLPAARRDSLKRMLKDRIRVTKSELASAAGKEQKITPSMIRRAEEARQAAAREEIGKTLKSIQALQKDGKTAEAQRLAEDLVRNHPDSPAALAAARTARAFDSFASGRRLENERERGLAGVYREIEKSSTPATGDVDFPKDWPEKTKARSTAVKLTAQEKAILQALNTKITVNFKNSKLQDVLEYLRTRLDVPLVPPDQEALKEVEASYDTPISLNLREVTARTVLRRIFADLGMTYVVRDEAIHIVSNQRAKDLMVVRSYYIGDILAGMGTTPTLPPTGGLPLNAGGVLAGPGIRPFNLGGMPPGQAAPANQQPAAQPALNSSAQNASVIMDIVKSSVDPQSWRDNGGNGTISFHAASMSLIIRQSAEVHALLANGGLGK